MADHELEIKFTGDWSGLRSQAEREAAALQARLGNISVGGGGGNAVAVGTGAQPAVQQAISEAFSRIDARRNAGMAVSRGRVAEAELSPVLRAAQYDAPAGGGAQIIPLPMAAMGGGFGGGGVATGGGAFPGWGDRRGFQRMLAAEQAGGGGGGDEGGGGGLFQRRFPGRLGRYATAGFALYELSRFLRGYQESSNIAALGGGTPQAQYQSELNWQNTIGGFPFLGGFASQGAEGIASGLGFSGIGSQLIVRNAAAQDVRTREMFADRLRLRGAQAAADIASEPDEFRRAGLQARADLAASQSEAQSRRLARGTTAAEANAIQASEDTETRTRRIRDSSGSTDPIFRTIYSMNPTVRARFEAQDEAARAATQRATIGQSEAQFRAENEAASRLALARLNTSVRAGTAYDINVRGEIRANVQRGTGDPFGAQVTEVNAQNEGDLIKAQTPNDRITAMVQGASRLVRLFGEAGKQIDEATKDAESRAKQNRALLSGDTLGAFRIGAERARDRALEALPRNPIYDRLRGKIGEETQSEIDLSTRQSALGVEQRASTAERGQRVAELDAARRPFSARAFEISQSAVDAARFLVGRNEPGDRRVATAALRTALAQEQAFKFQLQQGGQAIGIEGTGGLAPAGFSPSGTNQEQIVDALKSIDKSTQETRDALRQLLGLDN